MKILNLFFSATGNTAKVAQTITDTLQQAGHQVETAKITKDMDLDVLAYDFILVGSGVYEWLPGQPLIDLFTKLRRGYAEQGEIKPAAPRRAGKKVVVYCTYGGCHTGINEAIPAVKYMGQLFEHLGFDIVGEWYLVGEYHPDKYKEMSIRGRLGDIRGRPHEADLREVAEKVKGILQV
ncbi:MAG: flavodoxin [Deltaproteobacteria bacterium]|nr:flavodoxin [Deltaproteobacteria bacterium]